MAKKTFVQEREAIAKDKLQNNKKVATPQSAASDATSKNSSNSGEHSTPGNNDDSISKDELLARIDELISLLNANINSGEGKFQMDEQERVELRNFITTGVESKMKYILPTLMAHSLLKADYKKDEECAAKYKEEIETIKYYCREVSEDYFTVVALAIAMDDRSQRDLKSREDNNELMRKMRTNQNTALNAAVRFGKQLRTDILSAIVNALNRDKLSKPELRKNCSFSEVARYVFWHLPKYYILCFLHDKHVRWFLHTIVACTFVVLISLIGFMAHDLSECEVDADKYHLLRDWVNIDSTKAANKCFYLDALMEDRDNNAEEIQRLRNYLRNIRGKRSR